MAEQQTTSGSDAVRVLVAGASGYAGALAAQIIWDHPELELAGVTSRSDVGKTLDRLYPRYRVPLELAELDPSNPNAAAGQIDAAIVAYPHGAAAPTVAALREADVRVVDLSADFRLRDRETYAAFYGDHGAPDLFGSAIYGLPEFYRDQIPTADLVANPGCYPTASLLALAPLAEAGLIGDLIIDAKTGVSGSGRGGGDELSFVTLTENAAPYNMVNHRHKPEIAQELASVAGGEPRALTFVPHLLPLDQGELVSCYVTPSRDVDAGEVAALFTERYADEPFVSVVDVPPGMRDVRDSNRCHIHPSVDASGRVMIFATIDNLWKGAASQAVQNLNLMFGLPEGAGLR